MDLKLYNRSLSDSSYLPRIPDLFRAPYSRSAYYLYINSPTGGKIGVGRTPIENNNRLKNALVTQSESGSVVYRVN